jgi:hypothetical protein
MNINTLSNYVNQEVDDSFTVQQVTLWFNRGIANYNLIPPLTLYPFVQFGVTPNIPQGVYSDQSSYPLDDTFMLAVMAPYITSSIRSSESSITERQLFLQEFMMNAASFKNSIGVPLEWMRNKKNTDLDIYEIGEGIFISDFTKAPFAGAWGTNSHYNEIKTSEDEE